MLQINDNAVNPIIAMDFDGPCSLIFNDDGNQCYPKCGPIRKHLVNFIRFLKANNLDIVLNTCRENEGLDNAIQFLRENDIFDEFAAINENIAPWDYDSRKIYAHMYVDDRAYGWEEYDDILLDVAVQIMVKLLHAPTTIAFHIRNELAEGRIINVVEHMVADDAVLVE